MRPGVLASILLGAAACGEPAIKVSLRVPGEPTPPATFDYSCIGAVDVLPMPPSYDGYFDVGQAYANAQPLQPTCIDLPRAPTSMADLQGLLRGQLDIAVPPGGLQAMELRVRAGHCDQADWYREANIYGGGVYTGNNQLTVTLAHNLSCDWMTSYTFRPVDVLAMVADHACDPLTSGEVYIGDIRPTNFGVPTMEETGGLYVDLSPTVATVKLPTYSQAYQRTCLVAGFSADSLDDTMSCINPNAPHLCDATAFDVPYVSSAFLSNAETATGSLVNGDYPPPVLVTVVQDQAGQKMTVAGATVTIPSANAGSGQPPQAAQAQIIFGDPSDAASQTFTPNTTTQVTTASGMFMAYVNGVTEVDVSAPGPNGTTLRGSTFIGPDPFETTASFVVVK